MDQMMSGTYNYWLVALSFGIAVLTSYAAVDLAERVTTSQGVPRRVWLGGGAIAMGSGIWCMHYIGLLAYHLSIPVRYHLPTVVLSLVAAILSSLIALYVVSRPQMCSMNVLVGSLLMGTGIAAMHYIGMAAVSFRMVDEQVDYARSIDISTLASFGILTITVLILGSAVMTSLVGRRLSAQYKILEDERKMLRALIDHILDLMYAKDLEGRFILANIAQAERVGVNDPQLLVGKSDFDFYPLELANGFREDELRVMSCGEAPSEHEEMGIDVKGNALPMLTTKVPLRDNKGQIARIAGVGRDITQLKKSEAALRAAEQKYRGMFDEALVGIFKLGPEGHLIQANPAMAEFLGYESPEEMSAILTDPLWTAAVSPERQAGFMQMVTHHGYVKSFELEVFRKDGQKIWISSSVRAKYEGSTLVGFGGMFEDITERRILREQLLQAQKLESVGQLAAGIAHEINTPVQYIGDNVRFLRDTFDSLMTLDGMYRRLLEGIRSNTVSPELLCEVSVAIRNAHVDDLFEEIPKAIEQTLEGVSRVAALVSAMKEFSHPGTGEKVPLDLNRAIESTITVARNEWKYVAAMKLDLDASLPLVNCLPGEFNQVILNLIVNAAHAIADVSAAGSAAKGPISIETRSEAGNVEIRVQDTGGGIPEKVRSRIFDPFFTTKDIGKGTGQGLAIARSLVVDKHQGSIDVESEAGCGTTSIVRLPCELPQPPFQTQAAA